MNFEPFLTIKEAARRLGLPYFKLLRAVNAGAIPTYTLHNSRRLVRLPKVVCVIEQSRMSDLSDRSAKNPHDTSTRVLTALEGRQTGGR